MCLAVGAKGSINNMRLLPLQGYYIPCASVYTVDSSDFQYAPHPIRGYFLTEMAEEVPNWVKRGGLESSFFTVTGGMYPQPHPRFVLDLFTFTSCRIEPGVSPQTPE